jgi:hypothetical protein
VSCREYHYIRIVAGFVYLAVILKASSRLGVGYAVGRQIDTRLFPVSASWTD